MGNTKEIKKPEAGAKPEAKKEGGHGAPQAHTGGGGAPKGGAVGAKVGCHATGCKEKDKRASFCDEHFRQFKFGLITKAGEKVLDYEKKLEHYQLWLKSQKVA